NAPDRSPPLHDQDVVRVAVSNGFSAGLVTLGAPRLLELVQVLAWERAQGGSPDRCEWRCRRYPFDGAAEDRRTGVGAGQALRRVHRRRLAWGYSTAARSS